MKHQKDFYSTSNLWYSWVYFDDQEKVFKEEFPASIISKEAKFIEEYFEEKKLTLYSFKGNSEKEKCGKLFEHFRDLIPKRLPFLVDYPILVLKAEKLDTIKQILEDNNLTKWESFIIYLIAIIQNEYVNNIQFYRKRSFAKDFGGLEGELEGLVKLAELVNAGGVCQEEQFWFKKMEFVIESKDRRVESFVFKNRLLIYYFFKAVLDYCKSFDVVEKVELLEVFKALMEPIDEEEDLFVRKLAKKLNSFFKDKGFFRFEEGSKTSNECTRFISKIFDLALISVSGEDTATLDNKVRTIGNWIRRPLLVR